MLGVFLEAAAQAGDAQVDAAVQRRHVAAAEELFAGEDVVGVGQQHRQQLGFGGAEGVLLAGGAGEGIAAGRKSPAGEFGHPLGRVGGQHHLARVAAQDAAHPGDELARLEGLHHVVVGAQL